MIFIEPDVKAFSDVVWREVPPRFKEAWKPGLLEQIQESEG
jgi:hypothetical protein